MKTLIHLISSLIQIVSLIALFPFGWLFNALNLYKAFTCRYVWCFKGFGCKYLPIIQINILEYI